MADENSTKVIDFLRGRFDRVDRLLGEHGRKLDEVVTRLGALERGQADLRRDIAEVHVGLAAVNTRLDNLDRRVTRIEHRLDLVEDPA
jgi:hypothetical protein